MKSVKTESGDWKYNCEKLANKYLDFELIGVCEEAHRRFAERISSLYGHFWVMDDSAIRFYARQNPDTLPPEDSSVN